MELSVASFFLATSVTLLVAIAPAQTTHQRVSKQRTPEGVRNGTVKICQGLPIPPGYIVVAYMTTSACPHGAYLIKKQEGDSGGSVTANKRQDTESENSVAVNKKQDTQSQSPVATNKRQDTNFQSSVAVNRGVKQSAVQSTAVSRPRRVGTAEPETEAPSLRGVDPPPAPGPPTLGGVTAIGTPVNASPTDAAAPGPEAAAPGPEEVGEGDVVRIDTALVTVPVSVLDRQR